MIQRLRHIASQRTQDEWRHFVQEKYTNVRIWLQEHGEKAFVAGLIFGFLAIIFIKVIAFFVAIAAVLGVLIWEYAPRTRTEVDADDSKNKIEKNSEV